MTSPQKSAETASPEAITKGCVSMVDLRWTVGLHDYPKPGKDHPVSAAQVRDGRVTVECARCGKAKTLKWRQGPPPKDVDPPFF